MSHLSHILVPIDLDSLSNQAVEVAAGLVQRGTNVSLLHVIGCDETSNQSLIDEEQMEPYERIKVMRLIREEKLHNCDNVILAIEIDPELPRAICRYAQKQHVDIVILAAHSQAFMRHPLIGRVAEEIIEEATFPILLLLGDTKRVLVNSCCQELMSRIKHSFKEGADVDKGANVLYSAYDSLKKWDMEQQRGFPPNL